MHEKQFGFQKTFSTTQTIISLIENIERAMDNKSFVCRIFTDLQKAFDTKDHDILVYKLSHYAIRDIANCWLSFYLSNRKQFAMINGFNSKMEIYTVILIKLFYLLFSCERVAEKPN